MILMKEYVSVTIATMKMGTHFYSDYRFLREKNASSGNSMLNHPGHVTLTSWIFLNVLPVVGIIGI